MSATITEADATPPVAGQALTVVAADGAQVTIDDANLTAPVTDPNGSPLTATSAALDSGSAGAGSVFFDTGQHSLDFTPAAGFVGTAVVDVTVADGLGLSVVQPVDIDVVVQPSANPAPAVDTTQVVVHGLDTTTLTYDPSGDLIQRSVATVEGQNLVTTVTDGSGDPLSESIQQNLGGGETILQQFDPTWTMLSASITTVAGGQTVAQDFDGNWNLTDARITTVSGSETIVQDFNSSWTQVDATITQTQGGGVVETQHFNGNWALTSANLTTTRANGTVISQDFDGNWNQTDATVTTPASPDQTEIQHFDANWNQTSSTVVTINGSQTVTQNFDADWNMLGGQILTELGSGASRLDTYDGGWALLSEEDTASDGSTSWFVYGRAGGNQVLAASTAHSTTFVLDPGQVLGDTISGLHSLNLGGPIHDVIDFEGFGAGAQLDQVDATHWEVVSANHPIETFTLTGGAALAAGDYYFHG